MVDEVEHVPNLTLLNLIRAHFEADQLEEALDFLSNRDSLSRQNERNHQLVDTDLVWVSLLCYQLRDSKTQRSKEDNVSYSTSEKSKLASSTTRSFNSFKTSYFCSLGTFLTYRLI